jgi:hypothetical protein
VFRAFLPALLVLAVASTLHAEAQAEETGDRAMAARYAAWAEEAVAEGRWQEAEAALERAQDFAGVSSDVSYLLALVRLHENRPQPAVLEASRRALEADRWVNRQSDEARLIEAEALLRVRAFPEALASLARINGAAFVADASVLKLRALLGIRNLPDFRAEMARSLERFPTDGRFPRILFTYAANKIPEGAERGLIDTCLARLSRYLETAPDLAYRAVPFMRDTAEARRLLAAYRAQGGAAPEALIPALNLGLIDENQAITEFFHSGDAISMAVILPLWALFRNDEGRSTFRRNLSRYSGVISEDDDGDGYPESWTSYDAGVIREYRYDADQDGRFEWRLEFSGGEPVVAEAAMSAEGSAGERPLVRLQWDRYPWVREAVFEGITYVFKPNGFPLSPVTFSGLVESGPEAFLYTKRDVLGARLTRRTLVSFALSIERSSGEFSGGRERIELDRGIPLSAQVSLRGKTVAVTEYRQGRPVLQRVDLDADGRRETIRRYRPAPPVEADRGLEGLYLFEAAPALESSESDWDGDGVYETGEEYLPDGRTARSWDMNKDGVKEFTVIVQ